MKDVQCYELFSGIALRYHAFFISFIEKNDFSPNVNLVQWNQVYSKI